MKPVMIRCGCGRNLAHAVPDPTWAHLRVFPRPNVDVDRPAALPSRGGTDGPLAALRRGEGSASFAPAADAPWTGRQRDRVHMWRCRCGEEWRVREGRIRAAVLAARERGARSIMLGADV